MLSVKYVIREIADPRLRIFVMVVFWGLRRIQQILFLAILPNLEYTYEGANRRSNGCSSV